MALALPAGDGDTWRADAGASLAVHGPLCARRGGVEHFIRRVYAQRYGATVSGFAPVLVSLVDSADGNVVAAAGYRGAHTGPLFLERYLPAPVEHVLAPHAGSAPERRRIVEIGHLAADRAGAGRELMRLLGTHLAALQYEWAVCTLTRELRHLVARMGITPLALVRALPDALGDGAGQWGSYYEHDPVVLAGEVQPALRRLLPRRSGAQPA